MKEELAILATIVIMQVAFTVAISKLMSTKCALLGLLSIRFVMFQILDLIFSLFSIFIILLKTAANM